MSDRVCRALLLAYPKGYRKEHGPEILSTLIDARPPARSLPRFRDSRSVCTAGVRERVVASAGDTWRDHLRWGSQNAAMVLLALWAAGYRPTDDLVQESSRPLIRFAVLVCVMVLLSRVRSRGASLAVVSIAMGVLFHDAWSRPDDIVVGGFLLTLALLVVPFCARPSSRTVTPALVLIAIHVTFGNSEALLALAFGLMVLTLVGLAVDPRWAYLFATCASFLAGKNLLFNLFTVYRSGVPAIILPGSAAILALLCGGIGTQRLRKFRAS